MKERDIIKCSTSRCEQVCPDDPGASRFAARVLCIFDGYGNVVDVRRDDKDDWVCAECESRASVPKHIQHAAGFDISPVRKPRSESE